MRRFLLTVTLTAMGCTPARSGSHDANDAAQDADDAGSTETEDSDVEGGDADAAPDDPAESDADAAPDDPGESDAADPEPVLVEVIPGSRNHSPDGTWWGYNMTKIARWGDRVFTYYIDNDDDPTTPSAFRLLTKAGQGEWLPGASFPTSRPGNLVVDSAGALHVFVFEPTDIVANDSVGRLLHYLLPQAGAGDIDTYASEILVDDNGSQETVNIRVGAAIGDDDTLIVAFGHMDWNNPDVALSEEVYVRGPGASEWVRHLAGVQLAHEFYYPFVVVTPEGIGLLPVQDDWMGPGVANLYQTIPFFWFDGASWSMEVLADLSAHELANERARLLEQSDLFADSAGTVHAIYKEFVGESPYTVSAFQHWQRPPGGAWAQATYTFPSQSLNWLKLVEIEEELYFLGVSWDALYAMPVGEDPVEIDVPGMITGSYPYVAGPGSGTPRGLPYIDVLLLNGASSNYPAADNLYVRIPRDFFFGR